MKTYISGKITGLDLDEAKRLFNNAETHLQNKGMRPVNPMTICPYNPLWEWHHYMVKDIEELFQCDAIFMLSNWSQSKGARIEHAIARELGLVIIYQELEQVVLTDAEIID